MTRSVSDSFGRIMDNFTEMNEKCDVIMALLATISKLLGIPAAECPSSTRTAHKESQTEDLFEDQDAEIGKLEFKTNQTDAGLLTSEKCLEDLSHVNSQKPGKIPLPSVVALPLPPVEGDDPMGGQTRAEQQCKIPCKNQHFELPKRRILKNQIKEVSIKQLTKCLLQKTVRSNVADEHVIFLENDELFRLSSKPPDIGSVSYVVAIGKALTGLESSGNEQMYYRGEQDWKLLQTRDNCGINDKFVGLPLVRELKKCGGSTKESNATKTNRVDGIRKTEDQPSRNITVGSSLPATPANSSWPSPPGEFAFSFRKISQQGYLLAIWYDQIPDKSIVRSANRDDLAPQESTVHISADGRFDLNDPTGRRTWSTNSAAATDASMLNTSEFVSAANNSVILWRSFSQATDNLLPTVIAMDGDTTLPARISETNYSSGRFNFVLQSEGNVMFQKINYPFDGSNLVYWSTQIMGPRFQFILDQSGNMYVMAQNETIFSNLSTTGLKKVAPGRRLGERWSCLSAPSSLRIYVSTWGEM